jgi:hypothetical protein
MIVLLFNSNLGIYRFARYKSISSDEVSHARTDLCNRWFSYAETASGVEHQTLLKSVKVTSPEMTRNKSVVFGFKDFNRWFARLLT